jgi:UDP:flavonoid glycosyltransferase YjiC (YdhE family)
MPRTILFAWELGGGLGHLAPVVPLLARLRERGYRVVLAARDLSRARPLLGGHGVELLQAPIKTGKTGERIEPLRSFAHILHNCGFADFEEFAALAEAWRNLFAFVGPDLVLCDHAPVALIVARAMSTPRATIGTGFCCPPDVEPMPDFRPWLPNAEEAIRQDEGRVTGNVNRLLEEWSCEPIDRLGQLYGEVDECFLTTFAELDHYSQRESGSYRGPLGTSIGVAPVWPDAEGKRVFAYLKLTQVLPGILRALEEQEFCSLVYVERLPFRLKVRYESDRFRFASGPVDLEAVGRQCDLAILNGGHGSTSSLLLAGRPLLQIPLNLEQALTGLAVERMQAGLCVDPERASEAPRKLRALAGSGEFAAGAARFAEAHRDFDPEAEMEGLVERVCELAGGAAAGEGRAGGRGGLPRRYSSPSGDMPDARASGTRAVARNLPSDLAVVSVFFNPAGYRSTVENFRRFHRSLREQSIEFHGVEVAFGDAPFYVADLPGVRRVRTSDVMWQLERMINHTIAGLPDRLTKVMWLDADVFFENPHWFRDASEALDRYQVVQPFEEAIWLSADGGELRRRPGMVSAMRRYPQETGNPSRMHPGFAWAARRELIARHGVPDFCIVGGNDRIFANGIYDLEWAQEMSYFPMFLQRRIRDWRSAFAAEVKGQATWIKGAVHHLWHGALADRRYQVRNVPLLKHNFDPAADVRIGDDGAWHWATDKAVLHEEVRGYFFARRSDG